MANAAETTTSATTARAKTLKPGLPQLSNWSELTDSERDHAGRIARYAQERGYFDGDLRIGCAHISHVTFQEDRVERLTGYLLESLLASLTNADPVIAFRAYRQVVTYEAKLEELKGGGSILRFTDGARFTARARIERLMEGATH